MNAAENIEPKANPVTTLSQRLKTDMDAVNALILERMDSPVKLIPQLAAYLIAAGGKRVRPLLTLTATKIFDGDMKRAHMLAACVEFIHTATLLHDDVVDESLERRGQDAANVIFGNQASVLVGDFLFSRAFQLMTEDGSLEILRILSEASATISEGEVLQLTTANNLDTSIEDYINVVSAKTAALFAAACEVGPVIAGASKDQQKAMADYGLNIGIAFQIADDAIDYVSTNTEMGKTAGDDFREGKMTAPVLYAIQSANEEETAFWTRTLAQKDQTSEDFKRACDLIKKSNSIEKSLELAEEYAQKARDALSQLPQSEYTETLDALLQYTINRKS